MEVAVGWTLGLLLISFVLVVSLILKKYFKVSPIISMLVIGLIFNFAFVQTGLISPSMNIGLMTSLIVLGFFTLMGFVHSIGLNVNVDSMKKIGVKGLLLATVPVIVESLFWGGVLYLFSFIPGLYDLGQFDNEITKFLTLWILGFGISTVSPEVVVPRLSSLTREGATTQDQLARVSAYSIVEASVAFVMFIILASLAGTLEANSGSTTSMMELAWLPSLLIVSPMIGIIFAWILARVVLPISGGFGEKGSIAFFFAVTMLFIVITYNLESWVALSGFEAPWYDGMLATGTFGTMTAVFVATNKKVKSNDELRIEMETTLNKTADFERALFVQFGQPSLFFMMTFALADPTSVFVDCWMFILLIPSLMLISIPLKYFLWKTMMKWKGVDKYTSEVVSVSMQSRGGLLLGFLVFGGGYFGPALLSAVSSYYIICGLTSLIFTIPTFEIWINKITHSKKNISN